MSFRMEIKRRKSKKIYVGNVAIGGGSPISIQSMTTTDTKDVTRTIRQIKRLERAGCQIIRVAVPDAEAAKAIARIKQKINIPLVADIHFQPDLAMLAITNGADKIRLNPGNISKKLQIEKIIKLAERYNVPVRIGLNSGSVKRTSKAGLVADMISAALSYLDIFKKLKFEQIIFSFKSPDIVSTIAAYRQMAKLTDAPMHLGLTATGLMQNGIIKSSIAIGALLLEGIGDTMRVSLTADPVNEIEVAKKILNALNLRNSGLEFISCPTCGRCRIDLIKIIKDAEKALIASGIKYPSKKIKIAIMGCVVNGPGEARDADIGIAWGKNSGLLFKKGKKVKLVKEQELINSLLAEVRTLCAGSAGELKD